MKRIYLAGKPNKGKFLLVDDEDFEYLNQWKWLLTNSGYASRAKSTGIRQPDKLTYKYKTLYMHREIMGNPEKLEVDHINRDKLDNRRSNLRVVTRKQNGRNTSTNYGRSIYRGVSFDDRMGRKKWHAAITVDGIHKSLKYFLTEFEAAQAYNKAAREYHGKFARLNI